MSTLSKSAESAILAVAESIERDAGEWKAAIRPDKAAILELIERLQAAAFPEQFGAGRTSNVAMKYQIGANLAEIYRILVKQTTHCLQFSPDYRSSDFEERKAIAECRATEFINRLPAIRAMLRLDVEAAFEGDPAAYNRDEIIYSYPGLYAIMVNRMAHELYLLQVPLIPRIMTEYAHSQTGIDIHPGATLGRYFFIDHGTGVVVGETTIIGDRVKIYQGVTLGALSTRGGQSLQGKRRHPTIGNDVTIYSGASILGGDTIIGDDVVIGGNSFITYSIPAHTRVSIRNPDLQMKTGQGNPDGLSGGEGVVSC